MKLNRNIELFLFQGKVEDKLKKKDAKSTSKDKRKAKDKKEEL